MIFSHSAARALCDVPRNVPDAILRRLPENGGVVMVTFVAGFVDEAVAKVTLPAMMEYNLRSRSIAGEKERGAQDNAREAGRGCTLRASRHGPPSRN